jgi:hypothetical protein
MEAPKYDKNTIKWSGFFKDVEAAEESLQEMLVKSAEGKRVLSAKKELVDTKSEGLKSHGLYLYKFTIILV